MNVKTRLEFSKGIMTISFTPQASMGVRQGCAWEAGKGTAAHIQSYFLMGSSAPKGKW